MSRSKRVLSSLHLGKLLHPGRIGQACSPYSQVTYVSPSFSTPFLAFIPSTHQKLFFSSKQEPIFEIVLSNAWSKKLEEQLTELNAPLTHETVMYVLKKLEKDPQKASKFFNWVTNKNGFKASSAVYSLLLRVFANKDSLKEFWVTVKEMKANGGVFIDEETYKSIYSLFRSLKLENEATALRHFYERMIKENANGDVVREVVQVIKSSDWGNEVERQLGEMTISVTDNFVLRVLKELREIGCALKALNFFNWVSEELGFVHNSVTYNGIVRVLCREGSIEEFWCIVKDMKRMGFEMDLDTYIKVSRQLQKSKMLSDAVTLYEHMMDGPFEPSFSECNYLLRAIASCNPPDLDLLFRVVKKYESMGHSLSKNVYDAIHRSFTSLGRFDEAEEIMETMRNAGFEPDNITYSQLIFGLCKARRLEEACKVLDEMEGHGCIPDIKTWTILIQGHCAANEVDKALLCFAQMMERNVEADGDLLDVLINGFLSQERLDGACKLLVEMVSKARLRPWQATYKHLIKKLLADGKLEEALDLLRRMKKHNYPPFSEPFTQYISKFGTVEDAAEFLKTLSIKDYPSVSAYQNVLQSFFQEGRHSEAKDLLYKCPHHIRKHPAICSLFGYTKTSIKGKLRLTPEE